MNVSIILVYIEMILDKSWNPSSPSNSLASIIRKSFSQCANVFSALRRKLLSKILKEYEFHECPRVITFQQDYGVSCCVYKYENTP